MKTESVEEFLKRGGKIKRLEPGEAPEPKNYEQLKVEAKKKRAKMVKRKGGHTHGSH